jgi:hypothetical protein
MGGLGKGDLSRSSHPNMTAVFVFFQITSIKIRINGYRDKLMGREVNLEAKREQANYRGTGLRPFLILRDEF